MTFCNGNWKLETGTLDDGARCGTLDDLIIGSIYCGTLDDIGSRVKHHPLILTEFGKH